MQKSKILNLILASAVLVMAVLLTTKNDDSDKPTTTPPVVAKNPHLPASHAATTPCKKRSLGVKSELYPKPALVIGSYDKEGKPNMMTAAWVGICNSHPLSISVSMRPATYSHGNVTENQIVYRQNSPPPNWLKYGGLR